MTVPPPRWRPRSPRPRRDPRAGVWLALLALAVVLWSLFAAYETMVDAGTYPRAFTHSTEPLGAASP
jgi:hypothetical protein